MKQRMNAYAVAPDGVKALVAVETYLAGCGLEHNLLHLIKMRVSQINGCAYCLHMHSSDARKGGEPEAKLYLLNAWEESALYTPRERAALAWAEALTNIKEGHAPDAVFELARSQFSEKELADLTVAVAMINAWNRLAISTRQVHPHDRPQAKA
jgi:AhpD family alkylhydroperoxidase